MKSLCLSFVGDIGQLLSNEGYYMPVRVIELTLLGMFAFAEAYMCDILELRDQCNGLVETRDSEYRQLFAEDLKNPDMGFSRSLGLLVIIFLLSQSSKMIKHML